MTPSDRVDALLAAASEDGGVDCDGLRVREAGAGYAFTAGDTAVDGVAPERVRELAAEHSAHVDNWHHWTRVLREDHPARRAFLRWLEHAPVEGAPGAVDDPLAVPERYERLRDGLVREWGQLSVRVALVDGERRYRVRHADDADRPAETLTAHEEPAAARRLAKTDDDGRYRPLSTAPSLPTGWTFEGLSGPAAVRTVDYVYPATVANWHRELLGDLDVTHFREAADRQTGIYALVSELEGAPLEHLVEATCVDAECLKRREWDESADEAVDVPRGEGQFPCREPCSLFLAAAREVVKLEREEPREYTVELTPSEKEHLEGLLDAVAEGRAGAAREADFADPANRYRARYLRAKRCADRGPGDERAEGEADGGGAGEG